MKTAEIRHSQKGPLPRLVEVLLYYGEVAKNLRPVKASTLGEEMPRPEGENQNWPIAALLGHHVCRAPGVVTRQRARRLGQWAGHLSLPHVHDTSRLFHLGGKLAGRPAGQPRHLVRQHAGGGGR